MRFSMASDEFHRDSAYLKWVRTQPCAVRGNDCFGSVEAHHTARAYHGKKGGDKSAMPLCHTHHALVQNYPWKFEKRFNFLPDEDYAKAKYYKQYHALKRTKPS